MTRPIDPSVRQNARTLESLYTGLGVVSSPSTSGDPTPLAPPRTPMPTGMGLDDFPYMTGGDNRSFNLAIFGGGNSEAMQALLRELSYDAEVGARVDATIRAISDPDEQATAIAALSTSDSMNLSLFRTIRLMNFFRTNAVPRDPSVGGNTDGNPDVLTADEIQNWAWNITNEDEAAYRTMGGDAVARVHALLGLLTYVSITPEPVDRVAIALTEGNPLSLTAPEGGWRTGDRVFVGESEIRGAPDSGAGVMTIPAGRLPVGGHTVEIRRADGRIERAAVTVSPVPSHWYDVFVNHPIETGLCSVVGFGAIATAAILGIRSLVRSPARPPTPETGGSTSREPAAPPPPPPPPPPREPAAPPPVVAPPPAAAAVEFVIGKEPGERDGVSGFTLSNLPDGIAHSVSRNHVLVRVEGGRYLVQEIGQNRGVASIYRGGRRIDMPRATDANPWFELERGDAIDISGAVRLPFSGAPASGASPTSPFTLEVVAASGAPGAGPRPGPAPIAEPQPQPRPAPEPAPGPAAGRGRLDEALDDLDANDVAVAEVPNITTITADAIERQIRFLFPDLDNDRYNGVVQDLADETLSRLQGLGGEDYRTEFQHELASYRDAIRGAAPTRFLIRTIEERITVHRRSIDAARAESLIRLAEDDRSHAGRREELRDVFRRATTEAARRAAP